MPKLRAIAASFRHQYLHFLADPQWLIPNVILPFMITMVVLIMFQGQQGNFALYAVLGGGMMGMWGNTLYASGWSIQFDRWNGTLEEVLATPSGLIWIIAGRSIWNALVGIFNGLFILVIAIVFFNADLSMYDPVLFLLAFLATLLSLSALGLLFSSAFVLTRQAGVLTNGLEYPIYVGTGCMFPIALLPWWTNVLSYSLGPTWGIESIRYAAIGGYEGFATGYWGSMAIMAIISLTYVAIAIYLFRVVEMKARVNASFVRY
ncbi:MAG: ABC-2 type transporter [Methanomassiliicoccales archaeon PtaU1.Bin124]|nr:MAG: ABC-2 type transporter [Methanomassiliicoccales archaeon PtaU1.Bin124]